MSTKEEKKRAKFYNWFSSVYGKPDADVIDLHYDTWCAALEHSELEQLRQLCREQHEALKALTQFDEFYMDSLKHGCISRADFDRGKAAIEKYNSMVSK